MNDAEYSEYLKKAVRLHLEFKIELYTNKLKEFQDLKEWFSNNQDSLPTCALFNIGSGILKCPCPDITI